MKRVFFTIIALIMLLCLSLSAIALEPEYYQFYATVIDATYNCTTGKYFICAVGDVYVGGDEAEDPFTFSIAMEDIAFADGEGLFVDISETIARGQIISIIFDGSVMESYPMQIIPKQVIIEEEMREFTEEELIKYLSIFYSEEWLIKNGYVGNNHSADDGEIDEPIDEPVDICDGVPLAPTDDMYDGAPLAPADDAADDSEGKGGVDVSDDDYILYPLGPTDDGEEADEWQQMIISDKWLEGFIVSAEYYSPAYEPGGELPVNSVTLRFISNNDFKNESATLPVVLNFNEDMVYIANAKFYELSAGMKARIYCSVGASLVPSENGSYYELDGEVISMDVFGEYRNDYQDYIDIFYGDAILPGGAEVNDMPLLNAVTDSSDTIGEAPAAEAPLEQKPQGEAPIEEKPQGEAPTIEKTTAKPIIVLIVSVLIITFSIITIIKVVKKK